MSYLPVLTPQINSYPKDEEDIILWFLLTPVKRTIDNWEMIFQAYPLSSNWVPNLRQEKHHRQEVKKPQKFF